MLRRKLFLKVILVKMTLQTKAWKRKMWTKNSEPPNSQLWNEGWVRVRELKNHSPLHSSNSLLVLQYRLLLKAFKHFNCFVIQTDSQSLFRSSFTSYFCIFLLLPMIVFFLYFEKEIPSIHSNTWRDLWNTFTHNLLKFHIDSSSFSSSQWPIHWSGLNDTIVMLNS
jgi:hypothetical protein